MVSCLCVQASDAPSANCIQTLVLQRSDQLRTDQAKFASQQASLESWQQELEQRQDDLQALEEDAAVVLQEAKGAAASALRQREEVCAYYYDCFDAIRVYHNCPLLTRVALVVTFFALA